MSKLHGKNVSNDHVLILYKKSINLSFTRLRQFTLRILNSISLINSYVERKCSELRILVWINIQNIEVGLQNYIIFERIYWLKLCRTCAKKDLFIQQDVILTKLLWDTGNW
jgi:hypothetical protein